MLPLDAPDPDDPDGTDPTPGRVLLREVMGQDCVFIANDWHSGLVPVYLASRFRPSGVYKVMMRPSRKRRSQRCRVACNDHDCELFARLRIDAPKIALAALQGFGQPQSATVSHGMPSQDARSVFAIHNLAYQGVFPESAFNAFGLSREWFDRFRFVKVCACGTRARTGVGTNAPAAHSQLRQIERPRARFHLTRLLSYHFRLRTAPPSTSCKRP